MIAQAILESASGTSELAKNAHNYFGLKYRAGRCPSASGIYYKVGSEQNTDGTYTSSAMQWMKFSNMEAGVKGYFEFINVSNYSNLKGITKPQTYLENIKKDGYATSLKYVENLMNVINKYKLTKYDKQTEVENNMGYTNSSLVTYRKISPNKTSPRNHTIDTITIHCMAGNLTVETCGNVFAPTSRKASSNYGVGTDGRIALYVEEKDRSWASSNATNDNRAITIEVANDGGAPDWHVSDKAMSSLIELITDICKRNNIKKLIWSTNKNDRINHLNGCNMTVHRDFAAKTCPGDYLYNKHQYIADEVNKRLNTNITSSISSTSKITIQSITISKGNPSQFSQIVKNIKTALNTDYGLKFVINDVIDDILLINLSNVVLSTSLYKENITYVLQQLMAWWGYPISIDGKYGFDTQSKVKLFQNQVGIIATGTTTKDFWYKILGQSI